MCYLPFGSQFFPRLFNLLGGKCGDDGKSKDCLALTPPQPVGGNEDTHEHDASRPPFTRSSRGTARDLSKAANSRFAREQRLLLPTAPLPHSPTKTTATSPVPAHRPNLRTLAVHPTQPRLLASLVPDFYAGADEDFLTHPSADTPSTDATTRQCARRPPRSPS